MIDVIAKIIKELRCVRECIICILLVIYLVLKGFEEKKVVNMSIDCIKIHKSLY